MSSKVLRSVSLQERPFEVNPASGLTRGASISPNEAREEARIVLTRARLEAERLRREAHQEAVSLRATVEAEVRAAIEEGQKKGYEEGVQKARQELQAAVDDTMGTISQLLQALHAELLRNLRDQERKLVELAVAVAEKVVRGAGAIDPTMVVRVAHDSIERATEKEEITLRINPEDVTAIQAHLPDLRERFHSIRNVRVQEDRRVSPGGCIVETCSGYVDGTIERQLEEVRRDLGVGE